MAVRIAFSDGTFVSKPGLPSVVTKPNPVDNAVPVVLPYCGMLVTVVADGTDSEEPRHASLSDLLVMKAKQIGATVTFIEDAALLESTGGVAAFLRWRG